MKKHNVRVTRPEQDRTEAALKRRAKRRAARAELVEPYVKRIEALQKITTDQAETIRKLRKQEIAAATAAAVTLPTEEVNSNE